MSELKVDFAAFGAVLADRAIFGPPILEVLEEGKAEGIRIAPVRTGEYVAGFEVELTVEPTGVGRTGAIPRVVGRLNNNSRDAGFVEWGNGRPGTRQNIMSRVLATLRLH